MAEYTNLISAGDIDRRATLEAPVAADQARSDRNAEPGDDWTAIKELWVSITPLDAAEQLLAKQVVGSVTHVVRCRWFPGITGNMRWSYEGRHLYIVGPPKEIGRKQGLEMHCIEEER